MASQTPISEADLAALRVTLVNLPLRSLLKVQETVNRELQTRVDTEQVVEATAPPWRRPIPTQRDTTPGDKPSRRSRPY